LASETDLAALAGKFIVFDGVDGCGKTTQLNMLAEQLRGAGLAVVTAKDPGGTEIGNRIRHLLLDYDLSQMEVRCEVLLFMASRAQLIREVVQPALQKGHVVLGDRFVSSTCAYQGAAGGDISEILQIAQFAVAGIWPDLTIVLDVPVSEGFARTGRTPAAVRNRRRKQGLGQQRLFADTGVDAMEARPQDFHRRVQEIFLSLPERYPKPVAIVDGRAEPQAVHRSVVEVVGKHFGD